MNVILIEKTKFDLSFKNIIDSLDASRFKVEQQRVPDFVVGQLYCKLIREIENLKKELLTD